MYTLNNVMGVTHMKKALQTINTMLISTPSFTVAGQFTALHLAAIAWDLYCETAPTHFAGEFTIGEGGDFAAYNIGDQMDMANHYYDTAFSIGASVRANPKYSVQDAYAELEDICADTIVREEVSETVYDAVANYTHSEEEDGYIAHDYAEVVELNAESLPTEIARAEAKLAELKAQLVA